MNRVADPADARYEAALAWLFSRTRGGGRRTPERAARLLDRLGLSPPPLTALVVGTNGKGSVTSMLAAGLSAAGHKTGRFVSPHVESFRERVAVDARQVSAKAVVRFVERARSLAEAPGSDVGEGAALAPAFFEWTLALALAEFRRQGAGASVLEAGVGGASDATRAAGPVSLVVLTNVDLDHTDSLGATLEEIARDKAGAARAGAPLVSGVAQPALRRLVALEAERRGVPLHEWRPEGPEQALFALPGRLAPLLLGSPTREQNARLAAAALRLLGVDEPAVAAGLRAPPLPARGERFLLPAGAPAGALPSPALPAGALPGPEAVGALEVLLDGAHDPAAARRLLAAVGGRPYVLLFGALGRKQGAAVLDVLAERAVGVVLTEASAGEGRLHAWPGAPFVADAAGALDAALALALAAPAASAPEPPQGAAAPSLVLVAGSLYLAGRVRPLLRARGERLPAPWEVVD